MIDCPHCGGYGRVESPEERAEEEAWERDYCHPEFGFIGPLAEPGPLILPEIRVARGGIRYAHPA